ncbi:YoaK family protein [Hominifimenecus sp. rT4P-3]|uniref:YoaK family protein n=1 Tax=Hominifimenecus sp. rT4P-3 TaxID=3242979 RepID=UPI003DA54407
MRDVSFRQMSESRQIGILLALSGGFMDAYTYTVRGGVFANAQTGNIVLLGVRLAEKNWMGALAYLIPILAFLAGTFIVEFIREQFQRSKILHWRQICIAVEIFLLILVAFFPQSMNMEANVTVSFVCAMQVQSFRKINGIICATTMCTGNLRSGVDLICQYFRTKDASLRKKGTRYFLIDIFFLLGAMLGVLFTDWMKERSVLLCCGLLLAGFFLMFLQDKPEKGCRKRS